MVKVNKSSKNKGISRELRVILNRAAVHRHLGTEIINKRLLRVALERLNIPSTLLRPSPEHRFRRTSTSQTIRLRNRKSKILSRKSPETAISINGERALVIRIKPFDLTDVIAPVPHISPSAISPPPSSSSSSASPPVPRRVPRVPPRAARNPPPAPPRRRHAVIPRKLTYQRGVSTATEDLEELCNAPYSCGTFDELCRQCGAKFFSKEPKNRAGVRLSCCKNGQVSIPVPYCPPELIPLYTENSPRSREFLKNVRAVNSLFAMASFKTSAPKPRIEGQGYWSFSVCGQIYHFTMGVPTSRELREPVMSHYYFLDVEEVIERRNDPLEDRVSRDTIELIERSLRRHNRYIIAFRTMGEVLREEADRRGRRPVDDVVIAFSRTGDMNARRREFDLPESRSEIAAVFFGTEPPFGVDLKLYPRSLPDGGDRHHQLKNLHPMADPMVYPLLFPKAEDGYSVGIRHRDHKITLREFYRFRIQCRDVFSLLHNGGKLFQQYLVDAWVRVEADLLWWIRQNQHRFRFAAKQAIRRAIALNLENANRVGRTVVLPKAFPGGPRYMHRLYLDAVTVVARHGKPDLFITFTCNPKWVEIKDSLEYLQKPESRPDLICRVFRIKLVEFLDDIVHKQIYGVVQNYYYIVEFQKRGLPHAHIIVTFIPDDRIQTADRVDEIISAVIPDSGAQPRLYELVGRYQVHRPCGSLNPQAACMEGGRCRSFFPEPYSDRTIMGGSRDHRPIYRRPRDRRFIRFPDSIVTNTRIVPYNPYALAKYQAHINFEVVGSLLALKYLFKYGTKGADRVTIYENNRDEGDVRFEIDEVRRYLDCRYVSATEAAWRLLGFKMHGKSHSVIVLPVHLPGQNFVTFQHNEDLQNLENRLAQRSKLEAWFQLNATNEDARQHRYANIPEHFVWENRRGEWLPRRQKSKTVGSLAEVSAIQADLELFYLRLLLKHVRGSTSFDDLKTVDGVAHETFKDACTALNLLENVNEFDLCLREAALMKRPLQMRRLFALIVTASRDAEAVAQVPRLWRDHKISMSADFRRRGFGRRDSYLATIRHIGAILARTTELTCAAVGIGLEDGDAEASFAEEDMVLSDDDILGQIDEDRYVQRPRYEPGMLNVDQKKIFLCVLKAISRTTGAVLPNNLRGQLGDEAFTREGGVGRYRDRLFFVDGPGGSGKTFLYNTLITYVTNILNLPVVSVAWTGIAANLLIRGKTAHATFRLPLTLNAESTIGWHVETAKSAEFRRVALILWEEAAMAHVHAVEAVDRYLREVCDVRGIPMGGKCCVFSGDFRQILPVVPYGDRTAIIDASIKRLRFWGDFRQLKLKTNLRTGQGPASERRLPVLGNRTFAEWLLALAEGRLSYVAFEGLRSLPDDLIEIPRTFLVPDLESLLDFVYPRGFTAEDVGDRAILCPTNAMVADVNDSVLQSLEGEYRMYVSVTQVKENGSDHLEIPEDLINNMDIRGLPPHELRLKVGAVVTLLRNLDVESGEFNGSRLRVTELGDHLIGCRMLTGHNKGRRTWLPKIKMTARDPTVSRDIVRFQFPVSLAFATTIHKAQGQTLRRVGLYLKNPCFGHGQLYMAFSRVTSPENVKVYVAEGLKQGSFRHKSGKKFTRNVVYRSLLGEGPIEGSQSGRTIIAQDDIAGQTMERGLFEEAFPPTNLIRETEEAAVAEILESVNDPFVDEAGADLPVDFVPVRTAAELAARVSISDRPGTTGISLQARPTLRTASTSEDSD